jgi:hypothetical protein
MERDKVYRLTCLAVAGLAMLGVSAANALEGTASVAYTGEYTSNATRGGGTDESSDWIHRPSISLGLSHGTESVDLGARYRIMRRIYNRSDFDDQTITTGSATVNWQVSPDRLTLFATNSRTDTTIDSSGRDVPTNRQTVDHSSAGAILSLRSVGAHRLLIGYTFGVTNAEETRTDSQRHTGSLTYLIPLSPTRELALVGSYSDVDFDDELSPDYESRTASLRFSSRSRVLELSTTAGYQQTERKLLRSDVDGFIGSADLRYHVTPQSTVSIRATRSIRDNFDAGARGIPDFDDPFVDRTDTNDVYTENRGSIGFDTAVGLTTVNLSAYMSRRNYESDVSDEDSAGFNAGIVRQMTRNTSLSVNAGIEKREFSVNDREDTFFRSRLVYSITRWEALSVSLGAGYSERDSDESFVDHDEWNAFVTVAYRLF